MSIETLQARVRRRQSTDLPELYGDIDFDMIPERLALSVDDESDLPSSARISRAGLLADNDLVELMTTTTMLGDVVCGAYVCLMPELGMQQTIDMVRQACRTGIDSVADAPPQLAAFIGSMEEVPDWIDMDMVEDGAREDRIVSALGAPFGIRGAFLATFINEYAALPMAITGSLSDKRAARRVNETASFFATTVLPGGMRRDGPGFEAAAMVRLMHSMVRYNALRRSTKWDQTRFGIPIPQIDQMPAGLISAFLLASNAKREKRDYTYSERAQVEMARYRCHLLGLPEELLPTDPSGLFKVFIARAATLRKGYDDATCGELVRATMRAYLRPNHSIMNQIGESFERSFSTAFFIKAFLNGDAERAKEMGVTLTTADKVRVAAVAPVVFGSIEAAKLLNKIPPLRPGVDAAITWTLRQRLRNYGHAEYKTDASAYTHAAKTRRSQTAEAS
ncbi:MAG: DUF2236 domain-containing protein [Acidimicrobiia bacterium]|nr:DUF2236 domain-containing protein [Acidimicrobiia bacterium]